MTMLIAFVSREFLKTGRDMDFVLKYQGELDERGLTVGLGMIDVGKILARHS